MLKSIAFRVAKQVFVHVQESVWIKKITFIKEEAVPIGPFFICMDTTCTPAPQNNYKEHKTMNALGIITLAIVQEHKIYH